MFVCDKNNHCIGCNYQYADEKSDIDKEFIECNHLYEVAPIVYGTWEFGAWVDGRWTSGNERVKCSHCERDFPIDNQNCWWWCPQCGAKMTIK